MNVSAVEFLLPQAVIQQRRVVSLFCEIQASDREDHVGVSFIKVDEVGRSAAAGLIIGLPQDNEACVDAVSVRRSEERSLDVVLVDSHDHAAEAGDRLDLDRRSDRPGLAVVVGGVEPAVADPA